MCFGVWSYCIFSLVRGGCLITCLACGVLLYSSRLEEGVFIMCLVCGVFVHSS